MGLTKALLPNVLVLSAFWILTLWSLRLDRGLISHRTRRDWFLDLGGLLVQGMLVPLLQIFVLIKVLAFFAPQAQGSWNLSPAVAFLLNFVLVDYVYYLNHRVLHTKPFWPAHAVHHSIEKLDPVATSRNSLWTPVLIVYLWVNGLGLYFLNDPFWFLMGAAVTAALDLWRHSFEFANLSDSRLTRFLSRFLILPVDHAWHHSRSHADFNFGANLNFWDRIHGTFSRRRDRPQLLGIETGLEFKREAFDPYGVGPKIAPALRSAARSMKNFSVEFAKFAAGVAKFAWHLKNWRPSKLVASVKNLKPSQLLASVKIVKPSYLAATVRGPASTDGEQRTGISNLGRLLALFPLAIIVLTVGSVYFAFARENPLWLAGALFSLYLLPPLAFRLHNRFFPLETGMSKLSGGDYSPWWGGHQIQVMYLAVPSLEALLRIIPGAYSVWLRLWGSKVGRGVYWTPQIEITDRSLLTIGDHVVFAHKAAFYNHVANPRKDKVLLYVQPTEVQTGAFIGAGSRVGPGAVIEAGVQLPILTDVHVNQRISADMEFNPREKVNSVNGGRSAPQSVEPSKAVEPISTVSDPVVDWQITAESIAQVVTEGMEEDEILERERLLDMETRAGGESTDSVATESRFEYVTEGMDDEEILERERLYEREDLPSAEEIIAESRFEYVTEGMEEEETLERERLFEQETIAREPWIEPEAQGSIESETQSSIELVEEPSIQPIVMSEAVEFTPLNDSLDVESLDLAISKSIQRNPPTAKQVDVEPAAAPAPVEPVASAPAESTDTAPATSTPNAPTKPSTYRVEHTAA
ncbi:MAG: sterol desaturase family protein, partial [Bdellovibrionia bacterium]